MGQINVNPTAPSVIERDGSGTGMGMGLIMALLIGLALLVLVAWYAFTQTGWLGTMGGAGGAQTNVNVTNNAPPPVAPSGAQGGAPAAPR
jgi:hypothetical protein